MPFQCKISTCPLELVFHFLGLCDFFLEKLSYYRCKFLAQTFLANMTSLANDDWQSYRSQGNECLCCVTSVLVCEIGPVRLHICQEVGDKHLNKVCSVQLTMCMSLLMVGNSACYVNSPKCLGPPKKRMRLVGLPTDHLKSLSPESSKSFMESFH